MNYKPFNLELALAGAKVVTRDGRPVKIAGYNPDAIDIKESLLGWIDNDAYGWTGTGELCKGTSNIKFDLFMAPTERKEWIVIYTKEDKQYCLGDVFESEDLAHKAAGNLGAYYAPTVHEITITD